MKKHILFIFVLLISSISYSQELTNFHLNKTYSKASVYDYDLQKIVKGPWSLPVIVAIEIDQYGHGKVVTYISEKVILKISSSRRLENTTEVFVLDCVSQDGKEVTVYVKAVYNGYGKFYVPWVKIDDNSDNTAIIFGE